MKKTLSLKKIYVSPSAKRGRVRYPNKYFCRLKRELGRYFEVLDAENKPCLAQGLALFINSFKADVFLLSFVETIAFHKLAFIQYCLACLSLWIMKIRRKKIVFIFHNIRPHKGENFMSRSLTRLQMKYADSIISHSSRAVDFAKSYLNSQNLPKWHSYFKLFQFSNFSEDKVKYVCHPVLPFDFKNGVFIENSQSFSQGCSQNISQDGLQDNSQSGPQDGTLDVRTTPRNRQIKYDIFIWGDIMPYKGVLEFLENPLIYDSGLKISILGRVMDEKLKKSISKVLDKHYAKFFAELSDNIENGTTDRMAGKTDISCEWRRADFAQIAACCLRSRAVLFPYKTNSISGSGALIETIAMGGKPVGPNVGAFKDLAKEGLCYVYDDISTFIEEIKLIKQKDEVLLPELKERREKFIEENSWENFVKTIIKSVCRDEQ